MRLLLVLFFSICVYANTIIYNANIYTQDAQHSYASALVIDNGKFVYVGENTKALEFKNEQSKVFDLKGKFCMPGIIDSHTHTAIAALMFNLGVDLIGAKGKKEVIERLKAYKKLHPNKKLYAGFGFYPYAFGPNGPSKEVLDEIFPDAMAFFISNNGHQAWANSQALKFLNINKNTPDPLENVHYYVRDEAGYPTGFLIEGEAMWPHLKTLGIGSKREFKTVLKSFLPRMSALGITALYDAAIPAVEENAFQAIRALEDEGNLPLRYFSSHYAISKKDAEHSVENILALRKNYKSELFDVSSIKFINDNSNDEEFGIVFQEKELSTFLRSIFKANEDVMIHASQDESVHQSLNAIEQARADVTQSKSRVTLAHVNMVRDEDYPRFKKLGVIANIQPFDAQGGGYYEYRYMLFDGWENKLACYKHFFDEDVRVSASSDYPSCNQPLELCAPLYGIEVGVTRQKIGSGLDGEILDSKDERLSLTQMIEAYTINGAYQLHQEDKLGSIEVGKEADMIVLDANPFEVESHYLHEIKVEKTLLRGEVVYEH